MPRLHLIPILLLALATTARAQQPLGMPDPATTGRYYLLAFPDTTATLIDTVHQLNIRDTFVVQIYSGVPNRAVFSGAGGYYREVPLEGGHFTTVYLNDSANRPPRIVCDVVDTPMPDVIRLETDEPVVVYCQMYTRFGGEGWTPIPVDKWGAEYYAIAAPGAVVEDLIDTLFAAAGQDFVRRLKGAPAEILIIAAYNGTIVDIDGPGSIGHRSTTLNAGECYQVQAAADTPSVWVNTEDLSGTRITSNRPVGVVAGATRTWLRDDVPTIPQYYDHTLNGVRGMTAEWLSPASQFGREFAFCAGDDQVELVGTPKMNPLDSPKRTHSLLRIVSASNTTVRLVGSQHTDVVEIELAGRVPHNVRLTPGECYRLQCDDPVQTHLITSASVLYTEWLCGCTIGIAGKTTEVVPRSSWTSFAPILAYYSPWGLRRSDYSPFVEFVDSVRHFVTIATDTASSESIVWEDGSPVLFDEAAAIPGTDVIAVDVEIPYGQERALVGLSGARFSASMKTTIVGSSKSRPGHGWFRNYREIVGISMAYPLSPRRTVIPGSVSGGQNDISVARWIGSFPNPFSDATEVRFAAPRSGTARMEVYSALGEKIIDRALTWIHAGERSVRLDAIGCTPGAYVVRITGDGWVVSGRVLATGE